MLCSKQLFKKCRATHCVVAHQSLERLRLRQRTCTSFLDLVTVVRKSAYTGKSLIAKSKWQVRKLRLLRL